MRLSQACRMCVMNWYRICKLCTNLCGRPCYTEILYYKVCKIVPKQAKPTLSARYDAHIHAGFFLPPVKLCFYRRYCFQLRLYVVDFLSLITTFFTRNIQYTSTKLSGIICSFPPYIKFEYYNSNSLLCLD